MKNRVLICIDCQNDFITGALGSEAANAAVPNIRKLIDEYMANGENIICTMDTHWDDEYLDTYEGKHLPIKHCIYKSDGWQLDKRIKDVENYQNYFFIYKESFGFDDWKSSHLDQYDEITICGFCSSICCMANAQIIHALYPETPITFVENASAGLSEADHLAAITIMKDCQINVVSME